ncbi:MAG: monovalent cation/H(+) antiporter subunit G [Pseudomonadota bacterium]|nr:monovalent cation/H(+) antiporter subunit G [Pseudomonadota bacterium]
MEQILSILSWICLIGGSFFILVGAIGMLRMPDLYTRSHAAGITDTMGAILIIVGLMFQAGATLVTVKLIFILIFLLFTSPAASHALNNTAWSNGLRPKLDSDAPIKQPNETDGKD